MQFRVALPFSTPPAPAAVFAVHTTDPISPWKIGYAPVVERFSPHQWVYMSPEYPSPSWPDGTWDVWCQVAYPEPPVGGGGDSVVPGDPDLESAEAAALLCSWTPPPYGWPEGFPCQDNGQNDLFVGPATMSALNLTVAAVHVTIADGGGGVQEVGELYAALVPADLGLVAGWEVTLQDGYEIPDPATTYVTGSLKPLGVGPLRQSTSEGTPPSPPTVSGTMPNSDGLQPLGFYYRQADASEPTTGDSASNLGDWTLSNTHIVSMVCLGDRHARITVEATLGTAANPAEESYC